MMRRERGGERTAWPEDAALPSTTQPGLLACIWGDLAADVAKAPWIGPSLIARGRDVAEELVARYERLRHLPRPVRRALGRRGRLSLASVALLLALAGPEPGWAGTTISVSSGSGLASAITLANSQTGVYAGTNTLALTASIAVEYALNSVTSPVVIAGNGHEVVGSSTLTKSLFNVTSSGSLALQDTTVTGGKGAKGGAIYNSGTLTVTDSTLTGNSVSGYGGAIFNRGAATISNSTLSSNSAGTAGGALYNATGASMTLSESTVSGNLAPSGAGLGNDGTLVVTSSSVVSSNTATDDGGGIFNDSGTVTVSNSTVSGNSASQHGGGLHVASKGGKITVNSDSTIANNHAKYGGGLFLERETTVVVQNSTLSGNTSTDGGGAIGVHYGTAKYECSFFGISCYYTDKVFGGTLNVTYSTLSGNTSNFGGGIQIGRATSVTLENSTLSGNVATDNGGALNAYPGGGDYVYSRSNISLSFCTLTGNSASNYGGAISTGEHTDLTLSSTLVSGNHAKTGPNIRTNTDHSSISFGHNNLFGYGGKSGLSGEGPGTTDIVPSAALSAIVNTTLADNGGPTLTNALVSGSPAINAASTSCPPPGLDQRGYGRPASGSAICDIGAFEFGAVSATVAASSSSGQVDVDPSSSSSQSTAQVQLASLSASAIPVSTQASGQASAKGKGKVKLDLTAVLPHGLDLTRATARLTHAAAEAGAELVNGLDAPGFVLQRQSGAKSDKVSFATPKDTLPAASVDVKIKGNTVDVGLKIDRAFVESPLQCGDGTTALTSELVLSDGKHPSVRLRLQRLWTCLTKRGDVTQLEISRK